MGWKISRSLEPIYVDDLWDNPNYDARDYSMDCMMCPYSKEECDNCEVCYWDMVWNTKDD